jgi:hypothetical protein
MLYGTVVWYCIFSISRTFSSAFENLRKVFYLFIQNGNASECKYHNVSGKQNMGKDIPECIHLKKLNSFLEFLWATVGNRQVKMNKSYRIPY